MSNPPPPADSGGSRRRSGSTPKRATAAKKSAKRVKAEESAPTPLAPSAEPDPPEAEPAPPATLSTEDAFVSGPSNVPIPWTLRLTVIVCRANSPVRGSSRALIAEKIIDDSGGIEIGMPFSTPAGNVLVSAIDADSRKVACSSKQSISAAQDFHEQMARVRRRLVLDSWVIVKED